MATHKGTDGVVSIGGNNVGELVDWSLNVTQALVEDTAAGDTFVTRKSLRSDWSATINTHYDPNDTAQAAATEGATAACVFYPESGEGTGNETITCTGIVSGVSYSTPLDGIVPYTINIAGNSAVTRDVDS